MTASQIEALRELHSNWDGEGSAAPSVETVSRLESFCRALSLLAITPDAIDADPMGGAGLTIDDPHRADRFCYVLFANSGKTLMTAQGGNVPGYNLTHVCHGPTGEIGAMEYIQLFLGRNADEHQPQ